MNGPREVRLSTTPTAEAIADLRLGDIVYLDGLMYTAREGVYMRALEDRANIPMELPRSRRQTSIAPLPRASTEMVLSTLVLSLRPLHSALPNGCPSGWPRPGPV